VVLSTPKSSTPHRVSQWRTCEEYSVYPVRHRESVRGECCCKIIIILLVAVIL
jgi:hypothetical protein